jgi:hypothetical protein
MFSTPKSSGLTFDMFDRERTAIEASRARKLESLYHVGQAKIWDGRAVLDELVAKHGKPVIADPRVAHAIARIFSIIMWGELGAWRIAAQLADRLEPLEAKLAATSQAHDEARHFYVMHDYLEALGVEVPPLDFWSRRVIEATLETDELPKKITGMQLQIESIALTLFQLVRELKVEPVLSELLVFYERDEARHVGLGVQFLPSLLARLTPAQRISYSAFQVKLLTMSLGGLKSMEPELNVLGIDPQDVIRLCMQKLTSALFDLSHETKEKRIANEWVARVIDTCAEALFPTDPGALGYRPRAAFARARGAIGVLLGLKDGVVTPMRRQANEACRRRMAV